MADDRDPSGYEDVRDRVSRTIVSRPEDGFTPQSLADLLAAPVYQVNAVLADLAARGLVTWSDGEYVSVVRRASVPGPPTYV